MPIPVNNSTGGSGITPNYVNKLGLENINVLYDLNYDKQEYVEIKNNYENIERYKFLGIEILKKKSE